MSRVSIFKYTILVRSCVYSNNNDFEKSVSIFEFKKREKQKQKTQEKRDTKKKEKFLKSYRCDCAWCSTLSLFLSAFFFLSRVLLRTLNHRNLRLGCLPSFSRLFSSSFQLLEKLYFFSSFVFVLLFSRPNISGMRMLRRRYWRSSSTASNLESRE